MCQASCHFASVEADAKNVTGSVAAWNNRTSSAHTDVSDQVFSGCLVRTLSNKSLADKRLKNKQFNTNLHAIIMI